MNLSLGALWLVPVLVLPLAMAAAVVMPAMRTRCLSLLPFAPLPGLAAAFLAPEGTAFEAPDILLGARLALDGHARLFLGFSAFVWVAAGIFARAWMRRTERPARFCAFWCLTLAGNLGVFLAGDVATFYACFACVSLAAYPLVVHDRSPAAMRAGLVYIVLAMIGETCLLLGFMLGAAGAETLLIADVSAAIAASPWRDGAMLLLVAGFGIKAGLVPLHVWLPLAHPAAPTPASAVLSGAIVKAGVFGLIQFLPFGLALPEWREALVAGGLVTAFFGIAIGLTRTDVKTILAYSTVSQMGLVVAVLATALREDSPEAALAAASLYALHHGLAKGALFMGVGVIAASGARMSSRMLAFLALPALSLAGFPLTGGALAKLAAKPPLGAGTAELLVTLSAVGTALLMLRFLAAASRTADPDPDARPARGLFLPWLATVVAALVAPWLLFASLAGEPAAYPLHAGNLWSALWPIAAAAVMAAGARLTGMRAPHVPEGDLLAPMVFVGGRLRSVAAPKAVRPGPTGLPMRPFRSAYSLSAGIERLLSRWSVSGTLVLLLALLAML